MLYCTCGYTCGTKAALERHFAKFAEPPEVAALHGVGCEPRRGRPRPGSRPASSSGSRPHSSAAARSMKFSKTMPAGGLRKELESLRVESDSPTSPGSINKSESTSSLSSSMLLSPTTPPSLRSGSGTPSRGSNSLEGLTPARSRILSRAGNSTISLTTPSPCVDRSLSVGSPSPTSSCRGTGKVRVLLVRHAQSANKGRRPGQKASLDPELTDLGYEQADALAYKFSRQFRPDELNRGLVQIVSSPMRRCLLTIQPTVRKLKFPKDLCFCHGSFYEFGCAGTMRATSSPADINYEFPDFQPIGFTPEGRWDYRGSNDKEDEDDCRERCIRIADWLHGDASAALRARCSLAKDVPTLIFVTHQTVADLLCQVLVDGTASLWRYGEIQHRLVNAAVTEVFLHLDGRAAFGTRNDDYHLPRPGRPGY